MGDATVDGPGAPRRRAAVAGRVAVVVAAGLLSWAASGTRPFSDTADALTAVGFAAMAAVALVALRHGPRPPAPGPSARAWYVVAGVAVVWEVVVYVAGSSGRRGRFPTLSSLGDALGHWHAGRAAMFLVWLALGWGLFWQRLDRGGAPSPSGSTGGGR